MGGERQPNRLPEAKESRRVAAVSSPSPFGQNEWLVEEMYRKFREDPSSVDPSWHEFLVDYSPEPTTEAQSTAGNGQPAQPAAPAAAPEPTAAPASRAEVAAPVKAPEPQKPPATPQTPPPPPLQRQQP